VHDCSAYFSNFWPNQIIAGPAELDARQSATIKFFTITVDNFVNNSLD
jgi:hypothetical protein